MKVRLEQREQGLKAAVAGPVDIDTSPALRQQVLEAWPSDGKLLELDFAGVDYLSSPGIAVLLEFRHVLAKDGADVRLTAASPRVREVLATCRLDTLFLPDGEDGPRVPIAG
jgi:anti-sigma B factor antagonist